jgi:hypothetical protein
MKRRVLPDMQNSPLHASISPKDCVILNEVPPQRDAVKDLLEMQEFN